MNDLIDQIFRRGDNVLVKSKNKPPYEAIYHGRVRYRPGGIHGPLAIHPTMVFVDVNGDLRKVESSRLEKPRLTRRDDGTLIVPGFCRHAYQLGDCKVEGWNCSR